MKERRFWCYAHGRPGDWEAICIDLDLAVQGASFDDVRALLNSCIETYVQDALRETPEAAEKLMHRRAPLSVRLKHAFAYLASILRSRNDDGRDYQAGFDVPCRV